MHTRRFLASAALSLAVLAPLGQPALAATARASDPVQIYSAPHNTSTLLGVLTANEVVRLDRCTSDGIWCRVLHDGPTGWVLASFLIGAEAKIEATSGRSITDGPIDQDSDTGNHHHQRN